MPRSITGVSRVLHGLCFRALTCMNGVSEGRVATYVHDPGSPDRGILAGHGQCVMRRAPLEIQAASPGSVKASRWSPKSAMIFRRPPRAST